MKKNSIKLDNISFKFSNELPYFFHKVNVTFQEGMINFIQGSNGVGKSTFFRVLQGNVHSPEQIEGFIVFDNKRYNLASQSTHSQIAAFMGFVEQDVGSMVADQLSFEENLKIAALGRYPGLGFLPKSKSLPAFVAQFGIDEKTPVSLLSGGQRQILVILMMLQKSKKILLLDEPTAALDENNAQQVFLFLNQIARETQTIILVISHDKELVKKYSLDNCFTIEKKSDGSRILS